jgi:cation transporter-like permease
MDAPSAERSKQRKMLVVSPVLAPIMMEAGVGVTTALRSDPVQRICGIAAILSAMLFTIAFIILPGRQNKRRLYD